MKITSIDKCNRQYFMETVTTGKQRLSGVAPLSIPGRVSCRHGPAATPEPLQFFSCEPPSQSADKYSILVYRTMNHFLQHHSFIHCNITSE